MRSGLLVVSPRRTTLISPKERISSSGLLLDRDPVAYFGLFEKEFGGGV